VGLPVFPSTLDVPEDVHILYISFNMLYKYCTDKTCALKVKRINYPASASAQVPPENVMSLQSGRVRMRPFSEF
jgi:hypothetical protein